LRVAAGRPSYRQLAKCAHFSVTALSEAAGGAVVPTLNVTLAYVEACGGDREEWAERWQKLIVELALPGSGADSIDTAPYLGMTSYESSDAELFFGRERLVEQLRRMLMASRFVAVFAPSGAGKSSLLRAGLLPAIAAGAVPGSDEWVTVLLTPGTHPQAALAVRLAAEADGAADPLRDALSADPDAISLMITQLLADRPAAANILIMVDQFEVVFTLGRDEPERSGFVDALLAAAPGPRVRVVLGVRADLYARCAAYPALVAALHGCQMLVGPMDDDDLRRVVACPAAHVGLEVEPALMEVAVAEASGRPGALPLLSHALLQTWRRRTGHRLTLAGYRAGGGVRGSVAQTAEQVYSQLTAVERQVLRDVMLRLTTLGEGTEDTRRRVTRAELLGGFDPTAMTAVLGLLTTSRLITVDREGVTIAHEALIQEWPRLRGWLAEDRELLRVHRRLTEVAAEWDRLGRDAGFLYRGAALAWWQERTVPGLNDAERAFLLASHVRQQRDQRDRRRRHHLVLVALSMVIVMMGALATVAWGQARRAGAERDLAVSRQLTAQARSQLPLDPERALRLAQRAYRTWPTQEAEMVLRQAAVDHRVRAVIPVHSEQALGVAFSPDGRYLAATGSQGEVRMWHWTRWAVTGEPIVYGGHRGRVWNPVFSPDGQRLATAGEDGTVRIWSVDGPGAPMVLLGHTAPVWAVAFSPDARTIASAGEDMTVRLWDVATATELAVLRGHRGVTSGVAFSSDGLLLASSSHDRTVRLWNLADRSTVAVLEGPRDVTKTLVFTADGTRLACSSADGTVWVWPMVGGSSTPVVLYGHAGTVGSGAARTVGGSPPAATTRRPGYGASRAPAIRSSCVATPTGCGRWRSARTGPGWPAPPMTAPCGSGIRAATAPCCAATTGRCGPLSRPRTGSTSSPVGRIAPCGSGTSPGRAGDRPRPPRRRDPRTGGQP
jgi:hypothetical protein